MIQLIKGFKDILPEEIGYWQKIEKTAINIFENFGFKEIRIPLLEKSELFQKSIGEETDIVEKEMYTFADRSGDLITLRPEATASVVRSYIQHKMYASDSVRKFYTIGPMFRRERPQKGRYRQFYQINAEVFGVSSPLIDAQIIFMLMSIFFELSVQDATLHLNSLGCPKCRPSYKKALLDLLESKEENLCQDCKRRSQNNPLRVLDCKVDSCRNIMETAPSIIDFLCEECINHFQSVKRALSDLGIEFLIDKRLVRGLDYYTRTTFEIQTGALGAQSAVAGGGRYDGLVKTLGGPDEPAIGFAIGFDRLVEIIALNDENLKKGPDIFIAGLGDLAVYKAFELSSILSKDNIKAEMDFSGKSLKSLMKRADKLNAENVLIIGDKELQEGNAIIRNMKTKEQFSVNIENIIENIKEYLKNLK
ncbi:MAG: histidine--tRNA ligase [Desulfobacterales bacterium]|nr:histidine--tRNA ligase [Desulfobacterales bacterium]